MENPFKNINEDQELYNLMRLNPDMTYVKGYKNIFCEKNKDNNNIINQPILSLMINNKNQYNYDNFISKNDQNKFFVLNQIAPKNFFPNIVVGGHNPNNPNNFSMYDINNNKISNDGILDQFKSNFNEQNNNNMQNNNNDAINNNLNNVNEINNINNDIYKNFPNPNKDSNINQNNSNIQNPMFQDIGQNMNNNNSNININFSNNFSINQEEEKKIEDFMNSEINLEKDISEFKAEPQFKIKFLYRDSNEPIEYITNPDKKFSEVLTSFLQENNIQFQELPHSIHNCNVVNQEHTLRENYIKNGDKILLYNLNKKKQQSKLEEDDLEILSKFAKEYKANKLCEYRAMVENIIKEKGSNNIPKFEQTLDNDELIAFLIYKANECSSGIKILEHEHELVCVLTNFGWTCDLCKKHYSCQEEKFCCSFCDFYMCHECRKLKDYERRKAIKRDITPGNEKFREKYLDSKLHEHKLIYCITSRVCLGESIWACDKCDKSGNSWAFYCTLCDFDLCTECALNNK